MTLPEYLGVLRERWVVVVAAVVTALLVAGTVWFVRPPLYTASLTLYVAAQSGDTATTAYQGAQLSEQRVSSYVELVGGRRVSQDVVRALRLDEDPDDVADRIGATSALDSVLIDVAVTDRTPQRAADLANAVGRAVTDLVDELERPSTPDGRSPVQIRVVQQATPPLEPSSTGLPAMLVLGLLAGLVLGVGGALARHALDRSVTSPEQLTDVAGAPNLGTVPFDKQVPARPLTVQGDPQAARAEAFRALRTNLEFVDVDSPRTLIAVTSALPSEGKTTTLANLAIALASAGREVLVVEADLRRPELSAVLGLERTVGLTNVLAGRVGAAQAVQHSAAAGIDVLASGPLPPNPSELLGSQQMARLLQQLRADYDYVLVDTPPLLPVTDAAAVAPATDGVILVCRFRETRRDQVAAAAEALRVVSAPLLGTVLGMVPARAPGSYARYGTTYRRDEPAQAIGSIADPVRPARPAPAQPAPARTTASGRFPAVAPARRSATASGQHAAVPPQRPAPPVERAAVPPEQVAAPPEPPAPAVDLPDPPSEPAPEPLSEPLSVWATPRSPAAQGSSSPVLQQGWDDQWDDRWEGRSGAHRY